jgi:hypothetical protein
MKAVRLAAATLGAAVLAATALAGAASGAMAVSSPSPTQSSSVISVEIPGAATATPAPSATPTASMAPTSSSTPSPSSSGTSGGAPDTAAGDTPVAEATGAPVVATKPTKGAGGLDIGEERVVPGAWLETSASGYLPGEQVQIIMYSTPQVIGSYLADATGTFSARFQLPEGLRSGVHTVEATGWQSKKVTNIEFLLVSDTAASGTGAASTIPLIWWLLGILGVLAASVATLLFYFRASITRWLDQHHVGGKVMS